MSVVSCKLVRDQEYSADEKYKESVTLRWIVITDNESDGHRVVLAGARSTSPHPVPVQFASYAYGNEATDTLRAKTITCKQNKDAPKMWEITVVYDNSVDPGQGSTNPLERQPIDEWDTEQYQRALEKDVNGRAIVTPAGQPFTPPLTFDDSRPILTYTRNEATYPQKILTHQDAINSDQFLIFPPKTAKVNIRAMKRWENDVKFYEVKYTFHFRWDGWEREGLNSGTWFKLNASDDYQDVVKLEPGQLPLLLKQDGTVETNPDNASYSKFLGYRLVPFGPLNIVIY